MSKKIVIVGGVSGGASAATRLRRLDESSEIIMFEKGPNVSFSNCALPFHLSGIVENCEDLVFMTSELFKNQFNIEARTNSEVVEIIRNKKVVIVKDLLTGNEYEESYDKLILSPGAKPVVPDIEGLDTAVYFTVRNDVDINNLNQYIETKRIKKAAVFGGGFIGMEIAENLSIKGLDVTVVSRRNQVMPFFDYDMAQIMHKELIDHGVNLIVGDSAKKIDHTSIELASGNTIHSEIIIIAAGVSPDVALAKDAGIEIGETSAIEVDHNYLTNDCNIYAIGDAIETYNRLTMEKSRLTLAGPSQRQARSVADHIYNTYNKNNGVIGSCSLKLFDMNAAATGLNEREAKAKGVSCDYVHIIPNDKVGIMPNSNPVHFKLIYEVPTGRVLGAQAIGRGNVDKRIDVIAAIISMNGTLQDLKDLELCYSPLFGTVKDVVNYAGLVGLNLINGIYKQISVTHVRNLVKSKACFIDIRESTEYDEGHILNAKNIPLSELRKRLDEIPTDIPVYLYCRSGQRSYNAVMALQNLGYKNIYNISGSYLGLCYFEYFNDVILGRGKIVTEYSFI